MIALLRTLRTDGHPFLRRRVIIDALKDTDPPRPPVPEYGGIPIPQPDDCVRHHPRLAAKLAAAFQRLEHDGLVVDWPGTSDPADVRAGDVGELYVVTELGAQVRGKKNPAASVRARRHLGVNLHPNLAPKVRYAIDAGAFEQATMVALRAVEARVRALSHDPRNAKGGRLTGRL